MEYGLIGAKLGHSYSKIIHEAVCGYSYELHPLPTEEEAHAFMQAKALKAINVTIPYKKLVIPYCDEVEPRAAASTANAARVFCTTSSMGHNAGIVPALICSFASALAI